jgi:hypothetical protein
MNNFDTPEKIASIDTAIEFLLKENDIGWKNKRLYSWNWTDNVEVFPGVMVPYHSGVLQFYNLNGLRIKQVLPNIKVPGNIGDMTLSDYIRPTLITLRHDTLQDIPNNIDFVLNLNVSLFGKSNISNGNYVVSSIKPDARISGEHNLRSEIGKWHTLR